MSYGIKTRWALLKSFDRRLIYIALIGLFLRLIVSFPVFMEDRKSRHNDTDSYHKIGINLSEGHGYSNCKAAPYHKDIEITPVYPYFLAGIYSIFGVKYWVVVLIQLLLDILTLILVARITFCLSANEFMSLTAAFLYAISSHALTYSSGILTECLFTCLMSFLIYIVVRKKVGSLWLKSIAIGLLWGVLVLCRPIALYTLPLFLAIWFFVELKNVSWLRVAKHMIISALLGILLIAPWMQRNYELSGVYTISAISDYNLYGVNANAIISKQRGENENTVRAELLAELDAPLFAQCRGSYDYIKECREKGLKVVKENFWFYCQIHFGYVRNIILPEVTRITDNWELSQGKKGTLAVINKGGWIAGFKHFYKGGILAFVVMIPFILFWGFSFIMGCYGLYLSYKKYSFGLWFSLLALGGYFLFLPGPASTPRFMYPIVPLVCFFASLAILELYNKYRKTRV